VLGAEALLRWNHPVYGYISPLVTLSICDEAKLTNQLGSWVFQHAFQELRHWHDMDCGGLCLSANLSPKQLREDDNLVRDIRRLIQKNGH
jgi:EAL domain-containing protein (putative c-di-GMP-specific phosphodiesterase class I)